MKLDHQRSYRFLDFLMVSYVTVLLCANLIAPIKVSNLWGWSFGAGTLFFPLSYLFNDILTEVYGYARSRRIVWAGFAAMTFATFMCFVIVNLPPDNNFMHQNSVEVLFGSTWRIVAASLLAYFFGEFTNSFVLAKLKLLTEGKFLWVRTIGSTVVGEAIDTLIFYPIAFLGIWHVDLLIAVMCSNYVVKVMWEVLATPFTYQVINYLKKAENEDFYDRETNFSPFKIED